MLDVTDFWKVATWKLNFPDYLCGYQVDTMERKMPGVNLSCELGSTCAHNRAHNTHRDTASLWLPHFGCALARAVEHQHIERAQRIYSSGANGSLDTWQSFCETHAICAIPFVTVPAM